MSSYLDSVQSFQSPAAFRRPDTLPYPLYICAVVYNPVRFRTRWKLYLDFAKRCEESGAILYTCEVAYGDRKFVLDPPGGDPMRLLQLRTTHELWIKENALNLLTQRLPHDWEAVCFADADISWVRDDFADSILHGLQRYSILQPWSEAEDLTDNYEHHQLHHSFVYSWMHDEPQPDDKGGYYYGVSRAKGKPFLWHPGFCWAFRKKALSDLGGLLDIAVLGSGDSHMARCIINQAEKSIHQDIHPAYREAVLQWQERANYYIKQNIGYIPGRIVHYWHGSKKKRRYVNRWRILVDNQFNPHIDIKRDWQGLWQLENDGSERHIKFRDQIREYFSQRDEDEPFIKPE